MPKSANQKLKLYPPEDVQLDLVSSGGAACEYTAGPPGQATRSGDKAVSFKKSS